MSCPPPTSALLMTPSPWGHVVIGGLSRRVDTADGQTVLLWLTAAAAVITAVSLLCWFANRTVQRRRRYSHAGLFGQLCRLHNLDRSSRRLLRRLAGRHKLSQPARLLVDPRWLDSAAAPALPARRAELTALRQRLFGPPAARA